MRVLLDECLPRRLKGELVGHDARTVPEIGWACKRDGELLALAAAEFDVFLTVDRNLSFQQDLSAFDVAVIVLVTRSNNIEDLCPLARAAALEEVDHYTGVFNRAKVVAPPGVVPPFLSTDGVHFDRPFVPEERPALLAYLRKL